MKRVLLLYLTVFKMPLFLIVLSALAWYFTPNTVSATQSGLIGSILGVGLTFSVTNSFQKLTEHARRKRTFSMLKLVTAPYLGSRADSLIDTMKGYNDIDSFGKAVEFLAMASQFDVIANSFDKEWFKLVYSQEFLDAINSDDHFNALATSIKEVLLMVDQLSAQAINARVNLSNDFAKMSDVDKAAIVNRARMVRDNIMDNALKLKRYTIDLDREVTLFLRENGAVFSEVDR